jgi:serine/threonine-protein kinase
MKPTIGTILDDKYRIVRELGTGGMGAVYEGENLRIRRRVAIKLLHASVSSQAEAVRRFEREAEAAARIGSDHICDVIDMGLLPDGTRYMVMEYLDGETLGARIKRSGRMGPLMSIPIMIQVLDALGAAHAAGIIHRDLKPDNIFVLPHKNGISDFVKILDFGVSKFTQNSEEMNMTRAGAVVGTPYYMSPEQARGTSAVDARSDVYALGVLLYQASTGQVPFQAQTFNELLFKIVLEPAPPPQQYAPDLDPEFASIIQKAMAREPAQRYQSCAEFREALVTWMSTRVGYVAMPSANGARPVTVPPGGGLLRPPTPSGQMLSPLHQSQPPWAVASGAGTPPPGALGASGTQPPQTANAWGNASGVGQPARPPRSGLVVGVVTAVAIALVGGGGLALFFMNAKPAATPVAATQPTQGTEPTVAAPPAPPPPTATAAPTPTTEATADPVAAASAGTDPTAPTAPTGPTAPTLPTLTAAPPPSGALGAPSGQFPAGTGTGWKPKTPPTGTTAPKKDPKPIPGDFGY